MRHRARWPTPSYFPGALSADRMRWSTHKWADKDQPGKRWVTSRCSASDQIGAGRHPILELFTGARWWLVASRPVREPDATLAGRGKMTRGNLRGGVTRRTGRIH